jgi:hypothetical protein
MRAASSLLEQSTPDGAKVAATFLRLIDVKDEAHYGAMVLGPRKARDCVRWSRQLAERARQELER